MMRITKTLLALLLAAAPFAWAAEARAQQAPPMQPVPMQPSQATYTRYRGREIYWGTLGFGARFATLFNIPRRQFAMGGGAVIRMHPVSYPSRPASWMPLEVEFEIGYDRYLGERNYELSYGGSFLLHMASGSWQPYILASAGRSLSQADAGRDTRWHMGGGFGVGYRTRKFVVAAQVKGGGFVGIGADPLLIPAEGFVEAKLVGVVYAF